MPNNIYILEPLCLIPNNYERHDAKQKGHTNQSIELQLNPWKPSGECQGISLPTINYTLHYRSIDDDDRSDNLPCDQPGASHLCKEKVRIKNNV